MTGTAAGYEVGEMCTFLEKLRSSIQLNTQHPRKPDQGRPPPSFRRKWFASQACLIHPYVGSLRDFVAEGAFLFHLIIHAISFRNTSLERVRHITQLPMWILICNQPQFVCVVVSDCCRLASKLCDLARPRAQRTSDSQIWHPATQVWIFQALAWLL